MGVLLRFTGAALALIALFAPAANAQTDPVVLPPVTVSATTLPTSVNQIGNTVTVITAEDIEREQRRTVADLLNNVPGLQVVQNGSPGTQTSVFVRGTNSNHVKVLIDGIDASDTSTPNGAIDFGHILTADIEKVEVLRGPQSGLYGADAIGGVISITTKKGSGPAKATAVIEGGSFGTFNQAAGVSGSKDRFNYAFNVSHFHAADTPVTPAYMVPPGGSAMGNYYDNKTISSRLGANLSEYLTLNFVGRYSDAKLRYSNDDPATFPGVTYPTQSTYTQKSFLGRAEAVVSLLDGRFMNVLGVNYTDYSRTNEDPAPNPASNFNGSRDKYDWRGTFVAMPGQTLVAGIERENDRADGDTISAKTGNQAGYLEIQSEFAKRLFLVANVRHDDNDAFGAHDTFRVAPAFIVPVTETKLKASYGTGFKAPELYQLYGSGPYGFVGNPALLPETSRGYEVGFEQPLANDRVRFGLLYFHNDIDDLINYNNTFTSLVNVDKAVTYGEEAFVNFVINDRLRVRADYTRTTAQNAVTNTDLLRRPNTKVSLSASWEPILGLTISPSILYLGHWTDIDRSTFVTREAGGVTIVNLAANYVVDKNVTVFGRIDNLFNKRYENPLGWEQPGLGVYGGIKLTTN